MHWCLGLIALIFLKAVETLLRGHPLERPLDSVNLNLNVLNSTLMRGHPSLKTTFLAEKGWPHKRYPTVDSNSITILRQTCC